MTPLRIARALVSVRTVDQGLSALRGAAPVPVLRTVLSVVLAYPPDPLEGTGPASRTAAQLNLMRRAQFLAAADARVKADLASARARGESQYQALDRAAARERSYYAAHMAAGWKRVRSAASVDGLASVYGGVLGWNTHKDDRTTAECAAADGKNFYADAMPLIGWPGSAHPNCRCWASRPHAGAAILPSVGTSRRAA